MVLQLFSAIIVEDIKFACANENLQHLINDVFASVCSSVITVHKQSNNVSRMQIFTDNKITGCIFRARECVYLPGIVFVQTLPNRIHHILTSTVAINLQSSQG